MNYELIKEQFIKLKKEELDYINNVSKISSSKILTENEKLEIFRKLKNYQIKLSEMITTLRDETIDRLRDNKKIKHSNLKEIIIKFDLDKNYLSSLKFQSDQYKKYILEKIGIDIEIFEFKLNLYNLIYNCGGYRGIDIDTILNNQNLIDFPIYIFNGYYDYSEDCYGPCLGDPDDYLYGIYEDMRSKNNSKEEIPKNKMVEFEKDKKIIHSKRYVDSFEVRKIFEEELSNNKNKTLNDCVIETKKRVDELNYIRSPKYKEKVLLERINELYQKVKGKDIQRKILYGDNFLDILKNNRKNSVIVIAITQDKEYIITFQDRIKDKIIAEFPLCDIENNEDILESAKRCLKKEIGYITDDLFVLDEFYTSLEIGDAITYIVVANNCIKCDEKNVSNTEYISYGLFLEKELEYLINKNIMNGAINKLAYYNLINNKKNNKQIHL